jgi:tRNA pseudouridine13 synthase
LTREDVDLYGMTDVVLPLPGHSVQLPQNEVKDWYADILREDGLTLDDF